MASIRPKEVVQEVPQSATIEYRLAAKEVYKNLLAGLRSTCNICGVRFQELLYAVDQAGEESTEEVYAVLCHLL